VDRQKEGIMGVQDLLPFLRKKAPDAAKGNNALSQYAGKVMAIDANVNLYAFVHTSDPPSLGFAQMALLLIAHNITPLFIFDGPAGSIKSRTKEKRDLLHKQKQADWQTKMATPESFSSEELVKSEKYARSLSYEDRHRAFVMLQSMGVPVIKAPGESDLLIAALSRENVIDGCFTRDGDLIAHGVDLVVSGISAYGDNDNLIEYRLGAILEALKITYAQFVDMCMIMGNDYVDGVANMGPVKAWEHIVKYGTVENVRSYIEKERAERLAKEAKAQPVSKINLFTGRKPKKASAPAFALFEDPSVAELDVKKPRQKREFLFPPDENFPLQDARKAFTTSDEECLPIVPSLRDMLQNWNRRETLEECIFCAVEPLCTPALAEWFTKRWAALSSSNMIPDYRSCITPYQLRVKTPTRVDSILSARGPAFAQEEEKELTKQPPVDAPVATINISSSSNIIQTQPKTAKGLSQSCEEIGTFGGVAAKEALSSNPPIIKSIPRRLYSSAASLSFPKFKPAIVAPYDDEQDDPDAGQGLKRSFSDVDAE
jgi:flap endonuclease-1